MGYVIFTKIMLDKGFECWYYGYSSDRDKANQIAYELGHTEDEYHCVCSVSEIKDWDIKNVPQDILKMVE